MWNSVHLGSHNHCALLLLLEVGGQNWNSSHVYGSSTALLSPVPYPMGLNDVPEGGAPHSSRPEERISIEKGLGSKP